MKRFLTYAGAALLVALSANADIAFDSASDGAYSGGWSDGSNGGYGFGNWSLSNDANGGQLLGGTALGDPTFGLFSYSGGYSAAFRPFDSALAAGDTFNVDLAHTTTINGEIGLTLYNGATPVVTIKFVGGTGYWKLNDGGSDFDTAEAYDDYDPTTFSFTYNGDHSYSYSFGAASGENYTASSDITAIDGVRIFNNDQGGGENLGFNNLQVIPEPAVIGLIVIFGGGMLVGRRIFGKK